MERKYPFFYLRLRYISSLIYFSAVSSVIDQRKRRVEHISAVVGVVLFIILLAFPGYILWISIRKPITKTISVRSPTLQIYSELYSSNAETLTCPCSQPLIQYNKFITVQYTFHQICSSIFLTSTWISSLTMNGSGTLFPNDFRLTSPYSFQTLSTFCTLVQITFTNNLNRFYSNEYISISVVPLSLFESYMMSQMNQFMSVASEDFFMPLIMIQTAIENNVLLSALQTNYKQSVQNNSVSSSAVQYSRCNCALSPVCIEQPAIYQYPEGIELFTVPGFYAGCYVIESLLQSDLRCFYNQTCLDQLQTYLNSSMAITALNSALPSRYSPNTSINELLAWLMIEEINPSTNYDAYYDACQPIECTYTVQTNGAIMMKDDITYIIGILIGVIGGLIAILNLIVPRLVRLIVYGRRNREIHALS